MRKQLKQEYREQLQADTNLRAKLSADGLGHETTIRRQAVNNSLKLTSTVFVMAFKKHANIPENVDITEELEPVLS